jgi:c-di-GMP-binding flagellar brake protein YcgR
VTLVVEGSGSHQRINTSSSDLGEGGVAVQLSRRLHNPEKIQVEFTLPGTQDMISCAGEIAWENAGRQAGLRFLDLSAQARSQLKAWVCSHHPEADPDDPPVPCKLTDLSLGGCYLEMASPFPAGTKIVLSIRMGQLQVQVDGVVRVMHPEVGMGAEFVLKTALQREQVEKFIQVLMKSHGAVPDLLVEADGLQADAEAVGVPGEGTLDDPLVALFREKAELPVGNAAAPPKPKNLSCRFNKTLDLCVVFALVLPSVKKRDWLSTSQTSSPAKLIQSPVSFRWKILSRSPSAEICKEEP